MKKKQKTSIIFLLFLFLSLNTKIAFSNESLPCNLFFHNSSIKHIILIDKSKKTLYLFKVNNDLPKIILKFDNILLGENPGDKMIEGDKKTPEGIYQITSFIPPHKLHSRYGAGAFTLNYPNILDKKNGKTGYGIWIHGFDESKNKTSTKGCIALKNDPIKQLKKYSIIKSFVIITDKTDFIDFNEYQKKKNNLMKYINNYLNILKHGEIKKLSKLIDDNFIDSYGQNKEEYLKTMRKLIKENELDNAKINDIAFLFKNLRNGMLNFKLILKTKSYQKNLFIKFEDSKFIIMAEKSMETEE
jgi:murein L,D-transpeptidase YafK